MFIPSTQRELIDQHNTIIRKLKNEVSSKLIQVLTPKGTTDAIILFGSHARGDYNWQSDIDLIVVSAAFSSIRVLDRTKIFDDIITFSNIEIICYTPLEFQTAFEKGNPTIMDVLEYGQILYERDDYFKSFRILFQDLLKNKKIEKIFIANKMIWQKH